MSWRQDFLVWSSREGTADAVRGKLVSSGNLAAPQTLFHEKLKNLHRSPLGPAY